MSLISRLAGRQFISRFVNHERNNLLMLRTVSLKAAPYQPPVKVGHDLDNMKLGRPMSPHLSVYAPQLHMALSISHRITGVVLSVYMIAGAYAAAVLPYFNLTYGEALNALADLQLPWAALVFGKLMIAWPFCYHFFNGIRHLCWDTGRFLTMPEVNITGGISFVTATVASIILSLM